MTDDEFLESFRTCTLAPEEFNHIGHLRLAWLHLRRCPFEEAVDATCRGIRAYAAHLGAADKFHHTITVALLHLLRAGGAQDRALSWYQFVNANQELIHNARACLGRHYSADCLARVEARTQFVPPDLAPLPSWHGEGKN